MAYLREFDAAQFDDGGSAAPATTLGAAHECSLRARTVHTTTAHDGFSPEARHLILKNFSPPMSEPKPACGFAKRNHARNLIRDSRSRQHRAYIAPVLRLGENEALRPDELERELVGDN